MQHGIRYLKTADVTGQATQLHMNAKAITHYASKMTSKPSTRMQKCLNLMQNVRRNYFSADSQGGTHSARNIPRSRHPRGRHIMWMGSLFQVCLKHLDELFVIDEAICIDVSVLDHLRDLGLGTNLPEATRHGLELLGADEAVPVEVE